VKPCCIGADIVIVLEKAITQRLGNGVAWGFFTHLPERLQKAEALNERLKKACKDRGAVLAAGKTKVWKKGHRASNFPATKAADRKTLRIFRIREQSPPLVPSVETELVAFLAERATAILLGNETIGIGKITLDSAWDRAYSLHIDGRKQLVQNMWLLLKLNDPHSPIAVRVIFIPD
jgi:hypothetical protein